MSKGDFIGRDALLRIKTDGVRRKLCTLTLTTPLPLDSDLYGGEAVYVDGRVIGRLRSGGWGHTVARHIGLVYLPSELAVVGTPLEVEVFGARFPAAVAADVLYDPPGDRLRR
jgi:glycine cleavage system aminomethyltransferase T